MKYFYDTEFLEGSQTKRFLGVPIGKTKPTIDLISIGVVSEVGREYYAVSKDFNIDEAWNRYDEKVIQTYGDMRNLYPEGKRVKEYWIRENVLMPIFFDLAMREFHDIHFKDDWYHDGKLVTLDVFKTHKSWSKNIKWFKKLLFKYGRTSKQIVDDLHVFLSPDIIHYNQFGEYKRTKPELYGYYSDYDHVVLCWLFGKMKDLPEFMPKFTLDVNQLKKDIQKLTPIKLEDYRSYPKNKNCHNALEDAKWTKKLFEFLYIDNDLNSYDTRRNGKTTRTIDFAIQVLFSRGKIVIPSQSQVIDIINGSYKGYNDIGIDYIIDFDYDKSTSVQKQLLSDIIKELSINHSIDIEKELIEVDFQKGIIRLLKFKKQ
jgi:hypothetical protein